MEFNKNFALKLKNGHFYGEGHYNFWKKVSKQKFKLISYVN
jgi:hypothetical protein